MLKSQDSFQQNHSFITSDKKSQNEILNQYKQMKYGQESICFSIEQIQYMPLPDGLPAQFYQRFKYGIFIDCTSFYEMVTFALFQHLLRDIDDEKIRTLDKLKNLICNSSFLEFASYIKGLLLIGLQRMIQNSSDLSRPIANVLLGSEKIAAFSQCWKEIVTRFSKGCEICNQEINIEVIKIFTSFLNVDFHLYSKRQGKLELQAICSKSKKNVKPLVISVLLTNTFQNNFLDDQFDKKADISQISSIYGNWSYFIFLNNLQQNSSQPIQKEKAPVRVKAHSMKARREKTIIKDFTELFSINQEKSELDLTLGLRTKVKYTPKDCFKRGQQLLKQMDEFLNLMIQK